ncbi:MAG: penicillin-binding transpeptidase domain-containing protein, partial [bacterium]|nr:penicillin-binding transpeptidase domain-containing protein [bacterium]
SAFKPFVLVAYLEAGGSRQSYWDARSPLEIECEDPCGPDGGYVWTVRNAGSVDDLLTVAQATERSVNTVYAQLSVLVGPRAIIRTAHKMGITSDLEEVYSLALGAGVVSPLEMASAYSTFATNGTHAEPYLISRITTDEGEVIYQREVETTQAIDPVLAAAVRRPMERVVCCGTARRADIEGVPQAGKTGTHQAYRDAWFVGYVPNFTTAVWVGYPDEQISLEDVVINGETYSRVFGGSVPAPIWKEFMEVVLDKYPAGEFPGSLGIGYYNELPFTEVPDVTGMSATAARDAVLGAHLLAQVEEVLSPEARGTVLGSDPVAGQEVDQGSTVTIQVAGEISVLVVPALEGLNSEEALEAIQIAQEEAGTAVAIEILYQPADDPELVDRVLLTVPSAGELVPTDGALSLVIGN